MKKHNKAQKRKKGKGTAQDLSSMSVDDFMQGIGDSSDDEILLDSSTRDEGLNGQRDFNEEEEDDTNSETGKDDEDGQATEDEGEEVDPKSESSQLKQSLNKLKDTDPEFYKFLEEHDQSLLKFDLSDDSESEDDESQVHIPAEKLEEQSDESDYEDGTEDTHTREYGQKLTLKLVEEMQQSLQDDKSVAAISDVIQAFHAAVQRISTETEKERCRYKVDGSGVFNAVVQMCILELLPAIKRFLKLPPGSASADLSKVKKWVKVRGPVKSYLSDLLKLLSGLTSTSTTSLLLKHIHQLSPFIVMFKNLRRHYLRKVISIWGEGEDTIRVLAFMCTLKMTTLCQKTLLEKVLKVMYITYIKNSKFVSPSTLPGISFMRRSLNEMFLLDEGVSYTLAFLYIRQLAIHLRNGIVVHRKESIQACYNWQYMASLALWTELLSAQNKPVLEGLRFPLVQLIIGTAKLYPTPEYFPLKFHCIRMLSQISRSTRTFVPALPLIVEVLNTYDFAKKHTRVSMKPLDFTCILRVSNAQQNENGFKDVLIETIYSALLEYLSTESHSICFPDLVLPVSMCLKKFLKQCKVANFCRKMRQVLDKIEENVKFIENEKKSISFELSDSNAVEAWEKGIQVKGTPLSTYYQSWTKVSSFNEAKRKTEKINIGGVNIGGNIVEMMKKKKSLGKNKGDEGPVTLFPSDDDDDDNFFGGDSEGGEERKEKPKTKKQKKKNVLQNKGGEGIFTSLPSDESDDDNFFGGDSEGGEERKEKPKTKKQKKKNVLQNKGGEGIFTSLPSDESDDDNYFGGDSGEVEKRKEKSKAKKRALPQKSQKVKQSAKKKIKLVQNVENGDETVKDVVQDMSLSEW